MLRCRATDRQQTRRNSSMANVDLITFQLTDAAGKVAQCHVYVPSGETIEDIQALATAIATELDDVTAAVITEASVRLSLTLPGGLKAEATAGHYVNLGANFAFDAADTEYRHTIRVPGILEALLSGDTVIMADADVAAFTTAIVDGTALVDPSDRYGNDLVAVLPSMATFRR